MISDRLESLASKKMVWGVVLILCLGVRLGAGFAKGENDVTDRDARVWMEIAGNVANGHGFAFGKESWDRKVPTAYSEPGYPAFLALIYRTAGDGLFEIYVTQSILDTVTCLIAMMLAVRATGGRKLAGVLAGLAYSVYPPFVLSSVTPMTETLATFVITVAMFAAFLSLERSTRYVALAGLLMGIALLVRSPMTFFPIVMAILFFLRRKVTPAWGWKCLVYAGVAYLVFCPWVIRNYAVMDAFVLVPTRGSMAVWGATGVADGYTLTNWEYPVCSKEFHRIPPPHNLIPDVSEKTYLKITRFQERLRAMGEIDRDRALRAAALEAMLEHPGRFAFLAVKKVFRLWLNLWYDWPPSFESKAIAVVNALCLVLAILGFRRAPILASYKWLGGAVVLYMTAIAMGSCAVVRYSYPVMPLVLVPAAAYVAWLVGAAGRREAGQG